MTIDDKILSGRLLRSLLLIHLTNNKLHGLDILLVVLNEG